MKRLPVLLVLLVAVFAYSEKCPSSEELNPCDCQYSIFYDTINVRCVSSTNGKELTLKDIEQPLKSLEGKRNVYIYLEKIKLGKVPSTFFKDIGVKKLEISYCDVDSLADGNQTIFAGLEDSLEELWILGSFKDEDNRTPLTIGHLKKLKQLLLGFFSIKKLSNEWFGKGPTSLERIHLLGTGIKELGDRAFEKLWNLRMLNIEKNSIESIERSMLPSSAHYLSSLDLDKNELTSLPSNIFSNMPRLRSVRLQSNGIARLDQDTWESVWEQLDNLELEGNPLQCDSRMHWMFYLRGANSITGTCSSPRSKKGTSLKDFINKGQ